MKFSKRYFRVFKIYGSYLSQAVYQMYFDVCPDSRMNFTDQFKEFIASTISEWASGIIHFDEEG